VPKCQNNSLTITYFNSEDQVDSFSTLLYSELPPKHSFEFKTGFNFSISVKEPVILESFFALIELDCKYIAV